MLPEPLRQQLGRLKEQGCPAALVERAMGMQVVQFASSEHPEFVASHNGTNLLLNSTNVAIRLYPDGSTVFMAEGLTITIPPPKGDA